MRYSSFVQSVVALWLLLSGTAVPAAGAPPTLDGARINQHLEALSAFGRNPQGGVSRVAYSEADVQGREYVLELMKEAGLDVHIDAAGNLVGRLKGSVPTLKPIVIGSHIDSVPEGGNYDGDVGSLSAIEVARSLHAGGRVLRHPLEVIVFTNEEGVMLGSSALAGAADESRLNAISQSGLTVRDGVRRIGGDPAKIESLKRGPDSTEAYVELHIEQGAVLDREGIQIGVVDGIVGILDCRVTVEGFANHAGTTPMDQRHDAMLAAARFVEKVNEIVTRVPGRQVGTVGWLKAEPGAYNVVPGRVTLGLEVRDLDARKVESMYREITEAADVIGRLNGTHFQFEPHGASQPALTDPRLQGIIERTARELGLSTRHLPSGAGHDAQEMARIGPVGMIFVPSVGGISHSPKEFSRPDDIVNGARVLLGTVLAIDAPAKPAR